MNKWLVGIDEAGRGPLAGPVAVGVVSIPRDFDWGLLPGVNDSKKLSEAKRVLIYKQVLKLKKKGHLDFKVCHSSAATIDKIGIMKAIEKALEKALNSLGMPHDQCEILLDGSLKAPAAYKQQKTIIKGDAIEPVIGLASILAKVTRDQHMDRLARKSDFITYQFSTHKGYGTKLHREAIEKHGLSIIHRRSFCRNIHH